jgi:hypothetical protein
MAQFLQPRNQDVSAEVGKSASTLAHRQKPVAPRDFIPLHLETRTHVSTALMCWHLDRQAQTGRGWACHETYPEGLKPVRVMGRLAWPVAGIRRLLGLPAATIQPESKGRSSMRAAANKPANEGTLRWMEFPSTNLLAAHRGTWQHFIDRLTTTQAVCPFLRMAAFDGHGGSVELTGIEAFHSDGTLGPEEAINRLERASLKAVVYTHPGPEKPRLGVISPLLHPHEPSQRNWLLARLNGALGGMLSAQCFTQPGPVVFGTSGARHLITFDDPSDGFCLDELDSLDEIAIDPRKFSQASTTPRAEVFALEVSQ